jgi:hypothetical protein
MSAADLAVGGGLGDGADDEAGAGGAHLVDHAAQATTLALAGDPPRDADVTDRRHEDDVAAGQRDVRGDPRALARDRVLHDLDEDLLARANELRDVDVLAGAARHALTVVVVDGGLRGTRRSDVARVQERGLLLADVDEGGLHAREDPQHLAPCTRCPQSHARARARRRTRTRSRSR